MADENAEIDNDKLLAAIKAVVNEDVTLKGNTLSDLLELKKAVYPINNAITKELTRIFIDKLGDIFKGTPKVANAIKEIDLKNLRDYYYNDQNVNSNGYDFVSFIKPEETKTSKKKKDADPPPKLDPSFPHITAEIKANIPYEGKEYGSSQKEGLKKDIRGLWSPDKKTKEKHDPKEDYRFLVELDCKEGEYDSGKALEALKNTVENKDESIKLEIIDIEKPKKLEKGIIYIVKLRIEA